MVETATAQPSAQSLSASHAAGGTKRKRPSASASASVNTVPGAGSKAGANASAAVTKPKQSKSRNGCVTCKAKRLKCDETKPTCQQCTKRNVTCGGYKKDFKWRTFEETAFTPKNPPTKPTTCLPNTSSISSSSTTSSVKSPSPLTKVKSLPDQSNFDQPLPLPLDQPGLLPDGDQYLIGSDGVPLRNEELFNLSAQSFPIDPGIGQIPALPQHGPTSFPTPSSDIPSTQPFLFPRQIPSRPHPTPSHISVSTAGIGLTEPTYSQSPSKRQFHTPRHPSFEKLELEDDDPEIEEITRSPESMRAIEPWSNQFAANGFFIDPTYNYNQMHQILLTQPELPASSHEMLTLRFDRNTCGIMSICDGPTENPWRTWIMPLAQSNAALYHAIAAMSSFHGSRDVVALRRSGIYHSKRSLGELALGLGKMKTEVALATTLALAFSECWDTTTSAGIDHIKGARALVRQALGEFQRSPETIQSDELAPLRFLCKTWIYIDVLSRLTSLTYDDSNDFEAVSALLATPGPVESTIDPLMGCASTLFPIVGQVANLVRQVILNTVPASTILARGLVLKAQLESWIAPATLCAPEDELSTVQDSLHTAEAYRWSTLLYLAQAVPQLATLPAAAMANKALRALACVPLSSRTIIVQIYPLLAAGAEAASPADRRWVRARWAVMTKRMAISNLTRCVEVSAEVWRRRDEHRAQQQLQNQDPPPPPLPPPSQQQQQQQQQHPSFPTPWTPFAAPAPAAPFDPFPASPLQAQAQAQAQAQPQASAQAPTPTPTPTTAPLDGSAFSAPWDNGLGPEYTVRGKLHWGTVMREWNWEVLLG